MVYPYPTHSKPNRAVQTTFVYRIRMAYLPEIISEPITQMYSDQNKGGSA